MKNFYAAIALAAAICGSATAAPAPKSLKAHEIGDMLQLDSKMISMPETLSPIENENGVRRAANAADPAGMYVMNSFTILASAEADEDDEDFDPSQVNGVEVYINGTDAYINGWWDLFSIRGTYDPKTQTIRVPNKQTYWDLTYSDGSLFTLYTLGIQLSEDGTKIAGLPEVPYIEFEFLPEGAQTSSGETILKDGWYTDSMNMFFMSTPTLYSANLSQLKGGFYSSYGMRIYNTTEYYGLSNFVYDPSEWKDCGTADFNDGWFNSYYGTDFAYKVNVQQNVNNSKWVLLVNPYGANTPWADPESGYSTPNGETLNTTPTEPGYIFLDLTDPDCVLVRPFVNSGYSINGILWWYITEDYSQWAYIFGGGWFACTNDEGADYYLNGRSYDYIKQRASFFGFDLPTLVGTTVTLPKCRVQSPEDNMIVAPGAWLDDQNMPVTMAAKIELPQEALGVDGIFVDGDNAVKRYFNLQGLEIANPAAGEVVIVKEGNKAKKVIF